MDEINEGVEESFKEMMTIRSIFKGSIGIRRSIIITTGIMVCQQFSGINIIFSYIELMFQATGSSISPTINSIIIGSIQV